MFLIREIIQFFSALPFSFSFQLLLHLLLGPSSPASPALRVRFQQLNSVCSDLAVTADAMMLAVHPGFVMDIMRKFVQPFMSTLLIISQNMAALHRSISSSGAGEEEKEESKEEVSCSALLDTLAILKALTKEEETSAPAEGAAGAAGAARTTGTTETAAPADVKLFESGSTTTTASRERSSTTTSSSIVTKTTSEKTKKEEGGWQEGDEEHKEMLHKELPVNLIVDVLASEVTTNLLFPKGNTVLDHDDAHLLSKTTGSAGTTLILIDRQDAEDVTKEREKKKRKKKNKMESSEVEVVPREDAALLQRWNDVGASWLFRGTITMCCIVDGVIVVLALVVLLLMVCTSAVADNVVIFITGSGAKLSAFPPVPHLNGETNQNEEVRQTLVDKFAVTSGSGCTTSGKCFQSLNYPNEYGESEICSVTVQRLKKLTLFKFMKGIGIDIMMLSMWWYMYSYNQFLSSLFLSHFLPRITLMLQNLFVRNSAQRDGGRKKQKKYETNVRGKNEQLFYCILQQITFHIITHAAIITSTATYNDIKASTVDAAVVGFILILVSALVLVHEHVFNVLHVRSHAKHVLNLLKKMTRNNAVAVKLNLKSQERISSQEHGTVKRWNVNNGSVRLTHSGRRFAAAAGQWNYYFIGFLLLVTPHFANASFTPADKTALKTAVNACLSETDDGSCPIFAAFPDNTGNPYGVIGAWDVSSVTNMGSST